MDQNQTPLERAFQLAQSGECGSVSDIKNRMKSEGFSVSQVIGPVLSKQLRALIQTAKAKPNA